MSVQQHDPTRNPQTFGLALTAGVGVTLMMIAAGVGVLQADANTSAVAVTFVGGLLLLILGIVGWVIVTKPFQNFDDINVPKYTGHHGDHHDEAHDEHPDALAIIPHEEATSR